MKQPKVIALGLCWLLAPGLCHGVDRVEILVDASSPMWEPIGPGRPRIVAARAAITDFIVSSQAERREFEIGLRSIGGQSDLSESSGCGDTRVVVPAGSADPMRWIEALEDLDPRGGRGLVNAIERAADDLAVDDRVRRIVVLTSGVDQCHRDLAAVLDRLSQAENPVSITFIGLGMDSALASSLTLLTRTRNVNDPANLLDTLRWGALPAGTSPTRFKWLELFVTFDGQPVSDAAFHLVSPTTGEEAITTIDSGTVRARLTPGRFRASIGGLGPDTIELADITHLGTTEVLAVTLSGAPPVTLEVDPVRPVAGGEAYVQYWGAPPGLNWLAVAVAGTPIDEYLVRSPAPGSVGEVSLPLPDSPNQLELRFTQDVGSRIHQLLGRVHFETGSRRVSMDVADRAENRTQFDVAWRGGGLPGDYVTISSPGSKSADFVSCIPTGQGDSATVTAPIAAGEYVVRYFSRLGRPLTRSDLEVFEVLATLEGPGEVAAGEEFAVSWTGPDAAQDFLSIAVVGESDDKYRSFELTANGNPVRLSAPRMTGDYEIRYVRAADGEVLARELLTVVAVPITLDAPAAVEAGTRFEVSWSGTAGKGDFIAVAPARSGRKNHFDWAYTSLGSPITLAAPFEAGRYVVRYISGANQEIVARRPLDVR